MEPCPDISVLSSCLDRELVEDENARVKAHIQSCASCAGQLKKLESADGILLSNLRRPMRLSENIHREDCVKAETIISYFHGLLSPEETRRVESHLDLCDACLQELSSLAKTEARLGQSRAEPLPDSLRERVEAFWRKDEKARELILRVAVRLIREGIEVVRDSLFPQAVSFQEVFATAGAYRDALPKGSSPSGVLVKRELPGIQLSLLVEWEKENRAGLKVKAEDEKLSPLGGQRVYLRQDQVLLHSERTDADGRVVISNLEPGAYQLGIVILEKEYYVDLEISKA
jgi:anti-sigma factor RsiW